MDILLVISRLLDYPDESLYEDETELSKIVWGSSLNTGLKERLQSFIWEQLDQDILDVQSQYDGLFERGRSLGLWLFEHVHGESRDRGQAMVDLLDHYKAAGLELSKNELPDYIPLFLEFISTQGEENARNWLREVEHILALLKARLEKRESHYHVLFEALLELTEDSISLDDVRKKVSEEKPDNSTEAIDKEWEEEQVSFGMDSMSSCGGVNKPSESQRADNVVPVHWVGFNSENAGLSGQQEGSNS